MSDLPSGAKNSFMSIGRSNSLIIFINLFLLNSSLIDRILYNSPMLINVTHFWIFFIKYF
jgi:hypothetical protein